MTTAANLVLLLSIVILAGPVLAQESLGTPASRAAFERGSALAKQSRYAQAADEYRNAVDLDPDYAEAHSEFQFASKLSARDESDPAKSRIAVEAMTERLKTLYKAWVDDNPKRAVYYWALSELYMYQDYDKLEGYLRKAVALDPKFARAWQSLALVEEVRGNNAKQEAYLRKAALTAPGNPAYAFYYANSLKRSNKGLYAKSSIEVARRFPESERGAQSLYWLSFNETNADRKRTYLEQLHTQFPVTKFSWSSSGMSMLFEVYHRTDPEKALALAEEMIRSFPSGPQARFWLAAREYQRRMSEATSLLEKNEFDAASKLLDTVVLPDRFDGTRLFAAKAQSAVDDVSRGRLYHQMLRQTVKEPSDALLALLFDTGAKLKKTRSQVEADIDADLDTLAKPAAAVSLTRYVDNHVVSLADYRGKVVLLNFWYPFCGPCRGENPSLQKVLLKVGLDKFAILAVNVHPNEDKFVLPYTRSNRFDFVPLRGNEELAEKEWNARGFPTNFLIDPQGRVVYRLGPMRGESEERRFELQIRMLLDRNSRDHSAKGEQ